MVRRGRGLEVPPLLAGAWLVGFSPCQGRARERQCRGKQIPGLLHHPRDAGSECIQNHVACLHSQPSLPQDEGSAALIAASKAALSSLTPCSPKGLLGFQHATPLFPPSLGFILQGFFSPLIDLNHLRWFFWFGDLSRRFKGRLYLSRPNTNLAGTHSRRPAEVVLAKLQAAPQQF